MLTATRSYALACFIVASVSVSTAAQNPPVPTLVRTVDLRTHVEWRVNAQMQFDREGRLMILYRDKAKLDSSGNWHLIRLTDPLSANSHREEVAFSLVQEPENSRSSDRWDNFHDDLLLSPDESHAFAVFSGVLCTELPDPPTPPARHNVKCRTFSSAASFNLLTLGVIANKDISDLQSVLEPWSEPETVNGNGELLTLLAGKYDWQITALNSQLEVSRVVHLGDQREVWESNGGCRTIPDAVLSCPTPDRSPDVVRRCKAGRDTEVTQAGFGINHDEVCRLDSPSATSSGSKLLPTCHPGWVLMGISPDHHSLLAGCGEESDFLDIWYYLSRSDLEVVDASTLRPTAYLKLPTRSRTTEAVYHSENRTILAILKEAETLTLYSIHDIQQH